MKFREKNVTPLHHNLYLPIVDDIELPPSGLIFLRRALPYLKEFLVKKVNLAIAAVTASTLFGSIAVMAPQASAVQPTREVVPAASSTLPKPNLSPDCIQALKDEGKLSTEIKKQLLIAGLSAKDAARLAPKIAQEILTENGIVIKQAALSAIIAKDLGKQGIALSLSLIHI